MAEENSRTYLNFVEASFQYWLLAIHCRLFLRLGGLDIALVLVKEVIWKLVTELVSGQADQRHDTHTSCRAQHEVHAGLP